MTEIHNSQVQEVFSHNLVAVMGHLRRLIPQTSFVSMDTEFPGVVVRPMSEFSSPADYHYQTIRCNVDVLRLIQLGLTFCGRNGEPLPGVSTFQFNFKFNLSEDMYAADSIALLQRAGLDFAKHQEYGIDRDAFAELLISSGLVLNNRLSWVVFHGGYDFAYLLKTMMNDRLPPDEEMFHTMLQLYFPNSYDIKHMMHSCQHIRGGLNDVAEQLAVQRVGSAHQAGSDAMLTSGVFVSICNRFFPRLIEGGDNIERCKIYGLNSWR